MKKLSQSNRRIDMVQGSAGNPAGYNSQINTHSFASSTGSVQKVNHATGASIVNNQGTGVYIQNSFDAQHQDPGMPTAAGGFSTNPAQQNFSHSQTHRDLQQYQYHQQMKQTTAGVRNGKSQKMPITGGTQNSKSNGNITSGSLGGGLGRDVTQNGTGNINICRNLNQQSGVTLHNNMQNGNQMVTSSISPHRPNYNHRNPQMQQMLHPQHTDQTSKTGNIPMSSENQVRKSGVSNMNQINFNSNNSGIGSPQNPPMSPDNMSQPIGTMPDKAAYMQYNQIDSLRASRDQWNSPNQISGPRGSHHESNRTIDHSQRNIQQVSAGQSNNRKLQNFRKSRYAPNGGKTSGFAQNNTIGAADMQKSQRGPHIKQGLQIGHQAMNITNGAMIGNFPNTTKNSISQVQNKFQSLGNSVRDQSPKNLNNSLGATSVTSNPNIPQGHKAQIGFQNQVPHNGRVMSQDNPNLVNSQNQFILKSRGHQAVQQNQLNLSNSVQPQEIAHIQPNSTKNATGPQLQLTQQNFMGNFNQMPSPGLTSPYSQGLAHKQITLQNQQNQQNNKGSQKEIQLIQAYQQHTQRLKEQAQTFKKSRVQQRSIDINERTNQQNMMTPHTHNSSPWNNQNSMSKGAIGGQSQGQQFGMNDHMNSVRTVGLNSSGKTSQKNQSLSNNVMNQSSGSMQPASGVLQINSQRMQAKSNQQKLVDSKMSSLRHEQDSTATSNQNQRFPMTPDEAFKILSPYLWEVERREIFEYQTIYFFPIDERKKNKLNPANNQMLQGQQSEMGVFNEQTNNGFDTESNEYLSKVNEHLAYRWEVVKKIGKGSFGVVLKCYDHKNREYCALKILKNKKRLYKQGLVEAKLIKHLNDKDPEDKKNIIRRLDQFNFRKHLMITFEMLSVNLYEFIKMNHFQGFSLNLIKRFAIQILISLYYLAENNIVHCDLKPENILLRKINKSGIKIIDFGSGCFENEKIYTYIQSRFYRAPEIVLGIPYCGAIDMWSFGCILYELYVGYPLFPGEDEKDHMALMMEVKGIPPRSVLARSTRRKVFFDDDYNPIITPNSRGKIRMPNGKNLYNVMNCSDRDFVDFIDKCIEWKPEQRLTPEQAFSHPFISRAVNELKCLKDQPQDKQSSSAADNSSSQQKLLNTTGGGAGDQTSQRSYGGAAGAGGPGAIGQTASNGNANKTKSGSKLPTIRKN